MADVVELQQPLLQQLENYKVVWRCLDNYIDIVTFFFFSYFE